ncbi:phosphatase PAP2 family protein [archaeon]|nr:phosphatase PAP2 family protein [archaeon]
MTLDSAVFQFFESIQSSALTSFSKFVAIVTEPLLLLILAIVISGFFYFNDKRPQAVFLFSVSAITALVNESLKQIFKISRPVSTLIQETGFSFPSGHTTFAVVFFTLITYIFTRGSSLRTRVFAYVVSSVIVLIVVFTRIYLQVHWLTDVLGGLVLGGIILVIGILIHKKIISSD